VADVILLRTDSGRSSFHLYLVALNNLWGDCKLHLHMAPQHSSVKEQLLVVRQFAAGNKDLVFLELMLLDTQLLNDRCHGSGTTMVTGDGSLFFLFFIL